MCGIAGIVRFRAVRYRTCNDDSSCSRRYWRIAVPTVPVFGRRRERMLAFATAGLRSSI